MPDPHPPPPSPCTLQGRHPVRLRVAPQRSLSPTATPTPYLVPRLVELAALPLLAHLAARGWHPSARGRAHAAVRAVEEVLIYVNGAERGVQRLLRAAEERMGWAVQQCEVTARQGSSKNGTVQYHTVLTYEEGHCPEMRCPTDDIQSGCWSCFQMLLPS